MPRKVYTAEYQFREVSLVNEGQTPQSLAEEFDPYAPTIRQWVEADTTASHSEPLVDKDSRIRELERMVGVLKEEREISKRAAAWFAWETESSPKAGTRSRRLTRRSRRWRRCVECYGSSAAATMRGSPATSRATPVETMRFARQIWRSTCRPAASMERLASTQCSSGEG
jgi:transposase